MVLVHLFLVIILARYISTVKCSSSLNKLTSEELNTTIDEVWNCETVPDLCSIITTVNYRVPDKEFSIEFHCNVPPVKNEHSDNVFRKVTSYRMEGSAVCSEIGFGLEYLSFLENITLLTLEGYHLSTINNNTFERFVNLKQLELTVCKIQHATSDGFRYLSSLEKLVIENSAFMKMDQDVLFYLVQLKELTIEHCTGIDFNASVLANIELIDVKNSALHNIASIFDPLPVKLRVIRFVNVSSQENFKLLLHSPDEGQSAVQHIAMIECLLSSIVVRNMPQLVSLNLSKNSLIAASVEFYTLPTLVTLVLSHNLFETVTQTLFQFESSLDTIDLSHNRISFLHPEAFSSVHSLRMVNLSYNLLLNMESFQPHPRLERIEIDGNPWNCSWLNQCRLQHPTLFNIFRYSKRYDVLSVWGLPCVLQMTVTESNYSPSDHPTKPEKLISHPQGKIVSLGNKISLPQPRFTLSNPLKVIVSISVGVLVSNVIILIYNRYRNILHEPFYRYLARSLGDAVTEKSTSFWYEVPISDEANAIPLNNIYEEICESAPHRDIYDALNFRDVPVVADEQRQLDDGGSS